MNIKIFGELFHNNTQDLFLNGAINILFGKNGAGKTQVLNAVLKDPKTLINGRGILGEDTRWERHYKDETHYDSIPKSKVSNFNIYKFTSNDFENILMSVLNPSRTSFITSNFSKFFYLNFEENKEEINIVLENMNTYINSILSVYLPKIKLEILPHLWETNEDGVLVTKFTNIRFKLSSEINLKDISAGERKVLSIIMYLFQIPKKSSIILMDEPFVNLHSTLIKDLLSFFEFMGSEMKWTFLIATHNINTIKYHELENSISVIQDDGIKVINSYNAEKITSNLLPSIPPNIRNLFFNDMIETFFNDIVIIVEGISDKFYLDAVLKGGVQVISMDGKSKFKKTLLETVWHCKEIFILFDGDLSKEELEENKETINQLKSLYEIPIHLFTTDQFCDKPSSDIEWLIDETDGHTLSSLEKSQKAFKFKKNEPKIIKSEKFSKWIASFMKGK